MTKSLKVKLYAIIALFCVFGITLFSVATAQRQSCVLANTTPTQYGYYYNQLSASAKRFYTALDEMNKAGGFKSGNGEYDLSANKVVTQSQLSGFAGGNADLLKTFGIAKDAYNLDHPEIFYVDFDKVSLSVWTNASGTYLAKIDAGRTGSYYIDGGLSSVATINTATTATTNAIDAFISEANKATTEVDKVKSANQATLSAITYGFAEEDATKQPHIRTVYGGLVLGTAVCEGYARTFKALMDSVDIPCTIIFGYLLDEASNTYQPHAWNEVRLSNGEWYAVDTTLNDSNKDNEKYLLIGNDKLSIDHIADGTISNNAIQINYPTLAQKDYGVQDIEKTITIDTANNCQDIAVSYKNKNAEELKDADNLYLVAQNFEHSSTGIKQTSGAYALFNHPTAGHKTNLSINSNWQLTKLYVTKQAPSVADEILYTSGLDATLIVAESDYIENELFGTSKTPPVARNYTPSNSSALSALETYTLSVEFDEALMKMEDSQPIMVNVTSSRDANVSAHTKVENVVFDGNKTVSFKFTPSLMYQHNNLVYEFTFTNLVAVRNEVAPKAFGYRFERKSIVCSKVLSGDRLYMDVYGQPTLIDNSDLSLSGWKINGKQVMQNQRSQMALVVSEPNNKAKADMLEDVKDTGELSSKDILSYATYELELDICGVLAKIPTGSYVKLSFGFPSGYSAKDAGVTFKVYHFKYDENGNIDPTKTEELDCVITEYGLVVTVDNFSPFMVVALDSDKVADSTKSIYSKVVTNGGKITAKNADNQPLTDVATLSENGTITYTITPNAGYELDYVLLNKKKVAVSADNTITLSYADLKADNTIDFAFVASAVKESESANNLTSVNQSFQTNFVATSGDSKEDGNNKVNPTVTLIVSTVVALAIVALLIVLYRNFLKKKSN